MLELLEKQGDFFPPSGKSLEVVLQQGLLRKRGRVFVDLWDAEQFFSCHACRKLRIERLHQMNLTQSRLPAIICGACTE